MRIKSARIRRRSSLCWDMSCELLFHFLGLSFTGIAPSSTKTTQTAAIVSPIQNPRCMSQNDAIVAEYLRVVAADTHPNSLQ
ncbi:MAG: hypothetical protein JRN20_18140 [Nitrososphaerota archaeon]|nr:hypothetical protein [Nitrososphaerota archaeon]